MKTHLEKSYNIALNWARIIPHLREHRTISLKCFVGRTVAVWKGMSCCRLAVYLYHTNAEVPLVPSRMGDWLSSFVVYCFSPVLVPPETDHFLTCLPIVHIIISLHEWIVVRVFPMKASMCMLVLHQNPGALFSSWYEALAFSLGIYSDPMFTKAVADICLSVGM